MRDHIEAAVIEAIEKGVEGKDYQTYETEEDGHGRHEKRHYTILPVPDRRIRDKEFWEQLAVIGVCYRKRTEKAETSEETVYLIGSRVMPAERYGKAMRDHWRIENGLHWHLDITFREDANRVQQRTEAVNLSLLRKMALSMPKRNQRKGSIAVKRYMAALDPDFLAEILSGSQNLEKA